MSASTFRALHQNRTAGDPLVLPGPWEEPANVDYPKDPSFREKFGPRGRAAHLANPDGTQRIEDTGPLTKKRMETCDEEFRYAAIDFIKRQHEAETPFFV